MTQQTRILPQPINAPESRRIQANGLTLRCLDWGGDGPPVLLLHGISSQAYGWAGIVQRLQRDYRVLALDQRGHGDSDKPLTGYDPLNYADDIAGVIDALGLGPVHVVGHSLGGLTGLLCAARHADSVRSLVVIDIGPDAGSEDALNVIVEYIQSMPNGFASLDEATEQIFTHVDSFFPGYDRESARQRAEHGLRQEADGRWFWKYHPDGMIQTLRAAHQDWWPHLSEVRCPTLIIRGEWSMSFEPETAERMVAVIPHARWIEIEHAGHLIPQEAPDALVSALQTFFHE